MILVFMLGFSSFLLADVMVTIGTGTTTNGTTGVPTPYGTYYKNFRQQYLYTAAEITAEGGSMGPITSLAFNVSAVNNCSEMPNFTIRMKHTAQTVLTSTFEAGMYQQVWYQDNFLPVVGWNVHTLSSPFDWDGVSNLLVDICTTVIPGSYTQNASVYYTATTGTNTCLRYQSDTYDAWYQTTQGGSTGTLSVNRANLMMNIGTYVPQIPNPAVLVYPENGGFAFTDVTLQWSSGGGYPAGYYLYLGTDGGGTTTPTNLVNGADLGNVLSYQHPTPLADSTTFYWMIVPYNTEGNAVNCPIWSFNTPTPLTGTKTIGGGGDFATFTAAINALSINGVGAGGVTFNVAEGTYAENPPALTMSGTEDDPIIFQAASGTRTNPVLTPTGGTGTYGFQLDGADWITFDGIDVDAPATVIYGYWLVNGAENNTIKNCTITLPYGTSTNYAIRNYGANHNCSFLNNTFAENSYYGLYNYGVYGNVMQNTLIQGNNFLNVRNYGIYNYYATDTVISGNNISIAAGSTVGFYGIYATTGSTTQIYGNTISGGSTTSTVYGMYLTGTSNTVYGNTVTDLSSGSTMYGIYIIGGTNTVYGNKVHNLAYSASSSSIVYGISVSGGTTNYVYNNMIYDLRSPGGTSAPQIRALNITSGTTDYIWYNSVYLNAAGSAANFATAALYVAGGTTVELKNNIFVNTSTPGSTGRSVAFWKTALGFANIADGSDRNIYWTGSEPDATRPICYNSTTTYATLAEYKAAIATKDQGSFTEDVPFVSTTRIIDLHIRDDVPTRVEGNAIPITRSPAYDFDGDLRSTTTPDIGADEGDFTPVGGAPGLVTLLSPADGAIDQDPNDLVISWSPPTEGGTPTQYWVFIGESETEFWSTQIGYAEVDVPATSLSLATVSGLDLQPLTPYYWAVQAHNDEGESDPDDPGFMIWEFTTMERMTAPADLALGNIWPEDTQTGTIPVTNHGPVELTFTVAGPDEFEFGTTRFTVPRNSTYNLPYTFNTPATIGPYTGTIVLQQTSPDPAATPLNIAVTANISTDVIVGTGTVNLNLPVNVFWGYTYSQTIYYPSELSYPAGYRIEKLYYYFNGYATSPNTQQYVIYMGHTANDTFASTTDWVPLANLTQVYSGNNIPQQMTGGYWMEFVLDSPFIYNGVDNLVIAVDENYPGYDSSFSFFYCTNTTGINRSLRYYSDSTNPDPASPPTGTLVAGLPNTKFFVAPVPTTPQIMVNPDAWDFQTVVINTPVTKQFTISNTGAGTLSISNITIAGDTYFQLQNLPPEFPVNLTTGQTTNFTVQYLPTAAGTHTATVSIHDNRAITPVVVDGVCVDPRITSLPHTQNFDGVTTPDFPLGWTGFKSNASMTITTSTGYSQTTPNSVYMYNSSYTTDMLRLISPEVTVPINIIKASFYALTGTAGTTLKVGTVSALDGTGVFTQVAEISIPTTYTWYPFTVSFAAYAGSDPYLCFQHGQNNTYCSIYLDSVLLEELMPNDLAATALSGPSYGNVGVPLSYNVTVYNNGTATQNAYTVKLMKQDTREELASLDVTTPLDPGTSTMHTLSWTPGALQTGNLMLYGKVVLAGDGNSTNDETAPKAVLILPADTYIPLVGDPLSTTTSNLLPLNFYWKNSVTETIYTALEMQMTAGDILSVAYFNNFTQDLAGKPVKIWAKNTTATDLATNWLDFTGYTLVFDGVVDFPIGVNTIVIPLSAPFSYTGDNLALRVNRPMDTVYFNSTNQFYYTVPQYGNNRSRYIYSDSTTYDPTDNTTLAGSTLSSYIPVTAFMVTNAVPVVLAAPVVSFGMVAGVPTLSWAAVPGAYAYRVYASNDPYVWDLNAPPLAVVWTNTYTPAVADVRKFYKVVAVSSYRNQNGLTNNPATNHSGAPLKAEPAIGRTDNKD